MAQDQETTRSQVKKRQAPPRYKPPTATTKDTKSNADRSRSENYQNSRAGRANVRAVYEDQPVKRRSIIAHHASGPALAAVAHEHDQRLARNREIAQSQSQKDTKGDQEYFRGRKAQKKASQDARSHAELVDLARNILRAHAANPLPGVSGDTKSNLELATADAYKVSSDYSKALRDAQVAHGNYLEAQAQEAKRAENEKYSGSPGRLISGFIHMKGPVADTIKGAETIAGKAAPLVAGTAFPAITAGLLGIDKATGSHTLDAAGKIISNTGKEFVDIPANAVPSLYYALGPLAAGAVSGDSRKLGKGGGETLHRLEEPYKNLAKHPGKTFTEHPLSTALMVAGPIKAADRLAGRIEQGAYPHIERTPGKTKVTKVLTDEAQKHIASLEEGIKVNKSIGNHALADDLQRQIDTIKAHEGAPVYKNVTTKTKGSRKLTSVPSRPYQHIEMKLPGTAAKQVVLPRQGAFAYRLQKSRHKDVTRMSDNEIGRRADETFYTSVNQSRQDAYDAIANHQHKHPDATPKELEKVAKEQLQKSREFYRDQSALDMALRDSNGRPRVFHGGKFDDASKFIEKWGRNLVNQGRDVHLADYTHNDKQLKGVYHSKDAQTLAPYVLKTGPNKGKTILAPKIAIDRLRDHDSYLHQTTTSAILQGVSGTFRRTVLPFSPKWLANNYTEAAMRGAINGVGPASGKAGHSFYNNLSEAGKKEFDQLVKSVGHGGMQRQLLQEGTTWEEKLAETTHWKAGQRLTSFGQKSGPKAAMHLFDTLTDISFHHLNGHMENVVHAGMAGRVLRRHPLMTEKVLKVTHAAMNPEGKSAVEQRNNIIALGREVDRMFGKYGKFSPGMRRSVATWTPFIPWTMNAIHFITQHLPNDHPLVTSLIATAHQASQEWRNEHGLSYFVDGKLPPFLQGALPGSNGSHWMIFSQGTPFSVGGDPTGTIANNFNPLGSTIQANLEGLDWKGDKLKNDSPGHRLETAILSFLEGTTPVGYAVGRVAGRAGSEPNENLKNWANPFHPIKGKDAKKGKTKKSGGLFGGGKGKGSTSLFHSTGSGGTPSLFGG
jgi:hypothetical protein